MKLVYLPESPTMSRSASLKLVADAFLTCVSSRAMCCALATAGQRSSVTRRRTRPPTVRMVPELSSDRGCSALMLRSLVVMRRFAKNVSSAIRPEACESTARSGPVSGGCDRGAPVDGLDEVGPVEGMEAGIASRNPDWSRLASCHLRRLPQEARRPRPSVFSGLTHPSVPAEHNSPARLSSAGHSAGGMRRWGTSARVNVVRLLDLLLELLAKIASSTTLWTTGATRGKVPDFRLRGLGVLGTCRRLHCDPSRWLFVR